MLSLRMASVQLVLTDDWELRGNGSGNMRRIQFDSMRALLDIYERHGLKASFNAEVMQQLYHLQFGADNPALRELAREWEGCVREALSRGHDVQLHVHPQWHDAGYDGGRWKLTSDWSLPNHPRERARAMIERCKQYLETLLRPVDPGYRCVSFRSGAWCVAPSDHLLPTLADLGIEMDVSIVQGLHYEAPVRLDYRSIEEPFLPFYPHMQDARRVADGPRPIVCFPTHSFRYRPLLKVRHAVLRVLARRPLTRRLVPPDDALPAPGAAAADGAGYGASDHWGGSDDGSPSPGGRLAGRLRYYLGTSWIVSDLASLSFPLMRQMLKDILRRARQSGWARVPVVIENHTKDIGHFAPIERFAESVASMPDVEVITLRQLHSNLKSGLYPVTMRPRG